MRTGTWIESLFGGLGQTDAGPFSDEVEASAEMDSLGYTDQTHKLVVYTAHAADGADGSQDGFHTWDRDGNHVDGPFAWEMDADMARDQDAGEWVGQVTDGIRDESYWVEPSESGVDATSSVLYDGGMTTTTKEDLVVVTNKAIEMADELVKLAVARVADSKEEVEDLIAGLQERLDNEDLAMTTRERNLLDLTVGALQHRVDQLWRMSRG